MQSAKYLGIVLDQSLKWTQQLVYVCGKGSKWVAQIKRLTRPTWGLTPNGARKLFISIALPHILYGIDIWCTPIHGRNANGCRKGSVTPIKKLASVQCTGVLAVMGGFQTSPTDALDTHTALLPLDLKIKKACHDVITRITTLPQEHPLHNLVRKSAKQQVKRHRCYVTVGKFTWRGLSLTAKTLRSLSGGSRLWSSKFEENLVSFWWEVDSLYVLDRRQWEYLWEGSGKVRRDSESIEHLSCYSRTTKKSSLGLLATQQAWLNTLWEQ